MKNPTATPTINMKISKIEKPFGQDVMKLNNGTFFRFGSVIPAHF